MSGMSSQQKSHTALGKSRIRHCCLNLCVRSPPKKIDKMKFMKVPQVVTSAFCSLMFYKGNVVKMILIQMALSRQKASTVFLFIFPKKNMKLNKIWFLKREGCPKPPSKFGS